MNCRWANADVFAKFFSPLIVLKAYSLYYSIYIIISLIL